MRGRVVGRYPRMLPGTFEQVVGGEEEVAGSACRVEYVDIF